MPRTLPAGITALRGRRNLFAPLYLFEWRLNSGTRGYSSGAAVNWNGVSFTANRIKKIPSLTFGIIDRKNRDFPQLTLTLNNLPDRNSTTFPFQAIDAAEVFEDKEAILYVYSRDAETAFEIWRGRSIRPTYKGENNEVDLNLSFIFDSLFMPVPNKTLPQVGFTVSDALKSKDGLGEYTIPLYYGVGEKKIRPLIYRFEVAGSYIYANFIVSGTAPGLPFDANDVANLKLFDQIKPVDFVFRPGGIDTPPHNRTRFPDGQAHDNVAYGNAVFPNDSGQNQNLDSINPDDIRMTILNGRPLLDTDLPSENLPLILKDIYRDANYSLGSSNADFDGAALSDTAAYTSPRWQARLELHDKVPLIDLTQRLLGEMNGFMAFVNGAIHIKAKRTDEISVATFATIDSGQAGRRIHGDFIEEVTEKGFGEVSNQIQISYRKANRHPGIPIILSDGNAQAYAGGSYKKVVEEQIEYIALFDEEQLKINAACQLREQLHCNLFIRFAAPFHDALDVAHGDIITVYGKQIPNNASNYLFRVLTEEFVEGDIPLRRFVCQVYKPAAHNDDYAGLDVDLLRTGTDTSRQGRPDDVIPVSIVHSDPVANDAGGKLVTITATATIPADDQSADNAEGIFREPQIAAWAAYYRYADESVNIWRIGAIIEVTQGDTAFNSVLTFQIDFFKNRSIEGAFVALPPSRAHAPLGYVADQTKVSSIAGGNLSATAGSIGVDDSTPFAGATYVICEREIDKLTAAAGNVLTFDVVGSAHRKPYFETAAIAHPVGTQIAVAKVNYPTLTLALGVKFTYLPVTTVSAFQRPDGVKVRIQDVSADNIEDYDTYWTTNAGFAADVTKLGSVSPAWFTADPLAPPAGINLITGKMLHFTIPQEIIGAAGTVIYLRVAASNRRNYSNQLSPLVSSAVGDDGVPSLATQPTLVPRQIGLRVKCPLPTPNMKTFSTSGKVEIVLQARDGSNAVLGYVSVVGSDYSTQVGEYKFDIGLEHTHQFNLKKGDLLALFPAIVSLKVYFYVTNAVGISAASPVSSLTVATWEADAVAQDTTVPAVPAAPTVIPSAAKIKVKTKPPTSQIAVLVKTEIVARVKNGGGTILGYIIDGTTPTNNATEFKNDIGPHFKDTFNWKRSDIVALYPTAATIEFYDYVTNEIGTSAASAATALNVSTWEVDPPGDDIAAPSGLTAPIIKKLKKAGLRIRLVAPTAGNLKLRQANVYVANGAHGVATLFVSAADLTSPTATEANGAIEAPPSGGHTITVDRSTLESIFGAGATITVYATWTNDIGTSGFSSGSTYNLSTGEPGAVDQDTAVPSSLSVPTLVFIPRQGVHIENLRVTANWQTPADKWIVIYNQAGVYFDLPTYIASAGATVQAASSELVARYRIGPGKNHAPFGIKLHALKTVFGFTDPTNVYAYFYAANAVGVSSKSADSAALNLYGAKDIMGATDGVRVLDVAATMMSPANLLGNGDVLLVDNSNDEIYNWARWDGLATPLPAIGGTGFKVITSTSAEIAYVGSTDSLWLKANSSWQLLQTLKKRLKAGQSYTQTFMLRAASAITVTVKLHFYNLSRPALTGTLNLTSSINCVGTGTLAGTEFFVGDLMVASGQKRRVATITDATHWTVDTAFSAASGAMNVIIDNINNTINKVINLTTDYQIFLATLSMKNSPNLASTPGGSDYANHYFGLEITGNTQAIYDDYFMLVRGEQQMMFAPRGDENDNLNIGVVPVYISTPDVVSISGSQGGSYGKDSGGLITPL